MKRLTLSLFVLFLAPGCHWLFAEEAMILPCEFEEFPLAWDEASPQGVVPEDVLGFVEVTVEQASGGTIDHDGEERIAFEVTRRGDHAVMKYSQECDESWIYLPLSVSFKTLDSDALDEVFEVRTSSYHGNDPHHGSDAVRISHHFEMDDISGSFDPEPQDPDASINSLLFSASFTEDGGEASIEVLVETTHEDGLEDGSEKHWFWQW